MGSVPTQAALGPPHLMDRVGQTAKHAVDWSLPKDSTCRGLQEFSGSPSSETPTLAHYNPLKRLRAC